MRLVVVSNRSKPILTSLSSGWAHTVCVASDVAFAQSGNGAPVRVLCRTYATILHCWLLLSLLLVGGGLAKRD